MGTKNKHWNLSKEVREARSLAYKGRHLSPATEFKKGQGVGKENNNWKGGKASYYRDQGIKIWEEYWRKRVPDGYLIHHVDRDNMNNNICNLSLVTPAYHIYIHHKNNFSHPHTGVTKEKK